MGLSPVRRSGWRQPMVSRVETSIRLEKELLARFLSYKGVARTLGCVLSAVGSEKNESSPVVVDVVRGIRSGGRSLCRWWQILWKKECTGVRSIYTRGIGKGPSQLSASRRWVGGGAHLGEGKKQQMRGYFPPAGHLYRRRREREGLGGSLESVTDSGVEPDRWTLCHVPVSPVLSG
jgi:hypothetical protein